MPNKKSFILICASLLMAFASVAETTLIQGNAFYYRGKKIEVHEYKDLFTFKSEPIGMGDIPADGSFRFEINIDNPGLYLIKIGKVNAHLFVIPGDEYTVVIPEPLEMDRFSPAKDVFVLPEIFEATHKLNYYITEVEKDINQFLIENTHKLNSRAGTKMADSLITVLVNDYGNVEMGYFKEYMHWRLAEFEINTGHSKRSVFAKYFQEEQAAYDQLGFANAFRLLYPNYMSPHSVHKWGDSLSAALTEMRFSKSLSLLATDPYLQRQDFRELLFVTEMYELGSRRIYEQSIVLAMLDSIEMRTQEPAIRQIAQDARALLVRLAPGTPAPDFTFADVIGNQYRISEYQGRHIYIQFFQKLTPETLRQMSLMKVLKEGYGTDIAMFSLSTEESLRELRNISEKHDFDWFFGKIALPDQVINAYDLRAMPAYFLLDENLNLLRSPAPPPGPRIEQVFARLWASKHPNKNMPFKLQPPEVPEESAEAP